MVTGGYTLSYREAAQGPENAGVKGASVGRLAAAGFRVPGGFVLSVAAYEEFRRAAGLERLARSLAQEADPYSEAALLQLDRMRLQCLRSPLPDTVRSALTGAVAQAGLFGTPLAVRSSAPHEDSETASFAGVYRTLLNVLGFEALENAVRACWASLWSPRAVTYRRHAGIADKEAGMAVIIQRLVPAEVSGVAFSRNPMTGADEVVINAAWGLGESVVSGAVEPDSFLFRPVDGSLTLIESAVGAKALAVRPAVAGDVVRQPTPAEQRRQLSLTDEQALAIAETARRIEACLEGPRDIEWAKAGDAVMILQARPLTTRRGERSEAATGAPEPSVELTEHSPAHPWGHDVWSTANLAEVVPRVPSPLTWSMAHPLLEDGFRQVVAHAGYRMSRHLDLARRIHGRPYFNLAAFQWIWWDAFGVLPAETNRAMGGQQPALAVPGGSPFAGARGWRRRWRLLRGFLLGLSVIWGAPARLRALSRRAEEEQAADYSLKNDLDLLETLLEAIDTVRCFFPSFLFISMWSSASLTLLERLLTRRHGEQATALATALQAGGGHVASAEQGYLLERVAAVAANEPNARAFFAEIYAPDGDTVAIPPDWRQRLAGTEAGALFEQFLTQYGHRAVLETEVMHPRWSEDPSYPLQVVAGFVVCGSSPRADPAARARAAWAAIEAESGSLSRWRLRATVHAARVGARLRENAKSVLVRQLAASRRLLLETGERMVRRKLLARPEEIFFLRGEEIRPFLLGEPPPGDVGALAASRARQYAEDLNATQPDVVFEGMAPAPTDAERPAAPSGDGRLAGLAVSAGQVEGTARVLRHPAEGARLRPGDILVAPSTDPAWTPLFLRAAAVVVEVGGFLSHGAIVAREYGVPAVANVAGATERIRDGARLAVNGDTGEVRLLDDGPTDR